MALPRLASCVPAGSAIAAVAAAAFTILTLLGSGAPSRHCDWSMDGYDSRGTCFNPLPSTRVSGPYSLRHVSSFRQQPTDLWATAFACDFRGDPGLEILMNGVSQDGIRSEHTLVSWTAFGKSETTRVTDGALLCLLPLEGTGQRQCLVWRADLEYRAVPRSTVLTPTDLFVRNYAKEAMADQDTRYRLALEAASRGDTLHTSNRLAVVGPHGEPTAVIPLNGIHKPQGAAVVGDPDEMLVVVTVNSGYQVGQLSYFLLEQPRLRSRQHRPVGGVGRVYGSFRGLLGVDLRDAGVLWERRTGTTIRRTVSDDLNNDGQQEIIASTYAPSNAVSAGGTTDLNCAYVLCLDKRGNELWRHRFCGSYLGATAAIGDVGDHPGPEVVAVCSSPKSTESGRIVVLSGDGDLLREACGFGGMHGLVLADLSADARPEIVAGGSRGRLFVFDGSLNVLASHADTAHTGYESIRLIPLAANDIDGDGETEVAALSCAWTEARWQPLLERAEYTFDPVSYLVILGPGLQEEARAPIPPIDGWPAFSRGGAVLPNPMIVDLNGDGLNDIIALSPFWHVFEIVAQGSS